MVLLVAATAYLIGLQPALFLACWAGLSGQFHILAADQDRRLPRFHDNWSRRFHRDLFSTAPRRGGSNRPPRTAAS